MSITNEHNDGRNDKEYGELLATASESPALTSVSDYLEGVVR
jgi:hypothetical protein